MGENDDSWEPTSSFVNGENCSAIREYWAHLNIVKTERPILPANFQQWDFCISFKWFRLKFASSIHCILYKYESCS